MVNHKLLEEGQTDTVRIKFINVHAQRGGTFYRVIVSFIPADLGYVPHTKTRMRFDMLLPPKAMIRLLRLSQRQRVEPIKIFKLVRDKLFTHYCTEKCRYAIGLGKDELV